MFFLQGIVLIFNRNGYGKEVSFEFFPKYRQFIPVFFLRCDKKGDKNKRNCNEADGF